MRSVADASAAASRSTHSFGGTFGAGAAAGALLRLDERQARHLLSFCAQQASGIAGNVRDSEHVEKAFDFGGMPARNGVTAALMAAAGFTGVDDVFSGERNFFDAYAGRARTRNVLPKASGSISRSWTRISRNGRVGIARTIRPRCARLADRNRADRRGRYQYDRIASAVAAPPAPSDAAAMPDLNVQHLMAMLLMRRYSSLSRPSTIITDDSIRRSWRYERKIAVVPSEELAQAIPRRQAIVTVKTRDGRHLSRRTLRGSSEARTIR